MSLNGYSGADKAPFPMWPSSARARARSPSTPGDPMLSTPQRASGMLWANLNTSVGSYFCLTPIRNGTNSCVGLFQYALT